MKKVLFILLCMASMTHATTLKDIFKTDCHGAIQIFTEAGNMKARFCYKNCLMIAGGQYIIKISNDSVWVYDPEEYIVLGKLSMPFYRLLTGFQADSMEVSEWREFDKGLKLPEEIRLGKTLIKVDWAKKGVKSCPVMPSCDVIDLWY